VRVFAKGRVERHLFENFSYPEYLDYRRQNDALADLIATRGFQAAFRVEGGGAAVRAFGEAVSDNYFEMLGLRPALGRAPEWRAEGRPSTAPEVVLSDRCWRLRLHGDPGVVGKTIWLSGVAYTVVGVTPPSFNGTYLMVPMALDVWLPLGTLPLVQAGGQAALDDRTNRSLNLLGRTRADVDVAKAAPPRSSRIVRHARWTCSAG
jgi:hypothetical protein